VPRLVRIAEARGKTPGEDVAELLRDAERWLARVRASSQPAASMRLMASRTLTGTPWPYGRARTYPL
jgi:hypothetical protein